jgi:hypothetical protein
MYPPETNLSILRPGIEALMRARPTPDEAAFKAFIHAVQSATDSDKTAQVILDLFIEPDPVLPGHFRLTEVAKDMPPEPPRNRGLFPPYA